MSERVEFLGTMPLVDGVLKAHGDGGFRLVIDIPETELPAYIRLHLLRSKVLLFSVEEAPDQGVVATGRKRKKKADNAETEDSDRYFTD